MVTTWNKVLQGSPFLNKPLLLFEEWDIDFSELTIGTRVGIGEPSNACIFCSFYDMLILFWFAVWFLLHNWDNI